MPGRASEARDSHSTSRAALVPARELGPQSRYPRRRRRLSSLSPGQGAARENIDAGGAASRAQPARRAQLGPGLCDFKQNLLS